MYLPDSRPRMHGPTNHPLQSFQLIFVYTVTNIYTWDFELFMGIRTVSLWGSSGKADREPEPVWEC